MTVLLIILALLIFLFTAFLFTPVEFGLEIIKSDKKNITYLHFKIFKIPFKIPLKQKHTKQKEVKISKTEEKLTFSKFKETVTAIKKVYDEKKGDLVKMLSYTKKHLMIKVVDFEIRFGFDNAAATGISTGAIWTVGSIFLKIVDSLVGINKINMQVNPDFNNKIFEIYSKTILIIKPINLIIIVGQVLKTLEYVNNKINNINKGRV